MNPVPFSLFKRTVGPMFIDAKNIDERAEADLLAIMHAEPNLVLAVEVAAVYYRNNPDKMLSPVVLDAVLDREAQPGASCLLRELIRLAGSPTEGTTARNILRFLDLPTYEPHYEVIRAMAKAEKVWHELSGWLYFLKWAVTSAPTLATP
jgi:hypothetical protein